MLDVEVGYHGNVFREVLGQGTIDYNNSEEK